MSTAAGLPQFGSASALSTSPLASVALSAAAAAAAGKQIEGECHMKTNTERNIFNQIFIKRITV